MDNGDVLNAINSLQTEFAGFRAEVQSDYKHLKEMLGSDYKELKERVDVHGRQIDELVVTVAKNKESHDASLRTSKMFGGLVVGMLVLIEVAVVAFGVFSK